MPDVTEAGTPGAGGQLSGEARRSEAVKRIELMEQARTRKRKAPGETQGPKPPGVPKGMGAPPGATYGGPPGTPSRIGY